MKIKEILQEGITLTRKNLIMLLPSIAASVVVGIIALIAGLAAKSAISGIDAGAYSTGDYAALAGKSVAGMAVIMIINVIVMLIGHSLTVAMAVETVKSGKTTLKSSADFAFSHITALLVSAVIIGMVVGLGMVILVLPGIILAFLLMFTFVAVLNDDLSAFSAVKKSFSLTTGSFGDSIIVFLVLIALGVLVMVVNLILNLIPVLGQIISLILGGLYAGYSSVLLVLAYRSLTVQTE